MTNAEKERARKLAVMLDRAGENHGLLVVQGMVVCRDGVLVTDTPTMTDEADLQNAIALNLLEPRKVSGSVAWDWYVATPRPRVGQWILFKNGTRKMIDGVEKGIAFYGQANADLVPFENLVPAATGEQNCWEIDSTR